MDRQKKNDLPKMQVGFIDAICLPLYQVLNIHYIVPCMPHFKRLYFFFFPSVRCLLISWTISLHCCMASLATGSTGRYWLTTPVVSTTDKIFAIKFLPLISFFGILSMLFFDFTDSLSASSFSEVEPSEISPTHTTLATETAEVDATRSQSSTSNGPITAWTSNSAGGSAEIQKAQQHSGDSCGTHAEVVGKRKKLKCAVC